MKRKTGRFARIGTIADRIHEGYMTEALFEDTLAEFWPDFDRIGTDHYDNSLEVYFEENTPTDNEGTLEPTEEQLQIIWDAGFDRVWFNFQKHKDGHRAPGGFDKYYVSPESERRWAEYQARVQASNAGVPVQSAQGGIAGSETLN